MDYDDLIKKFGNFGKFHFRLYVVLFFPVLFNSFSTPIIVFFLGDQSYRCKLPDWQNDTFAVQNEYHKSIINSSIPTTSDGKYKECEIIRNGTIGTCTEWVFDISTFSNTIVSQFNLVCDRTMLRPHAMTTYFIGYAASTVLLSIVGDVIGRRLECCICLTFMFITNITMPFSTSVYMFAALRFLDGFCASTIYRTVFIMGLEFVTPQLRLISGTVIVLVFCVGAYILVLIAYFIRDWRWLQLTVAIPMAIPLIYWWPRIFPESPRWLLSRGRHEEAMKILQNAAKINNTPLDEDINLLKVNVEKDGDKGIVNILKILITSRKLVIRWLIVTANWFAIAFIYYGLTVNLGKFGGNLYANTALSITAEILGYSMCFLLDKTGRKPMHLVVLFGSSVACFLTLIPILLLDESYNWLMITFAMIGKFGISAGFGEIYIYTGEMFPTVVRSLSLGLSGAGSRLGSITSPYMFFLADGTFGKVLPFLLFGSLTFCVGLLSLKLPETRMIKLLQQVEDVSEEDIRRPPLSKEANDTEEVERFLEDGL
ncbi:organic cation transporter protein-like [Saccostrea echinata]|uniref:organic cation transporter protein-like n=1 Tax=Saccostrea echinata TaxID=191078 RepID=UPI002A81FC38|nr:organic cation transporter protein-like [Saccostrea echinata]